MDSAKQHWPILGKLGTDLANKVREFMVIGEDGEGLLVATEDGQGFWLGTMKFTCDEQRISTEPTPLDVPELVQMAQGDNHILLLNKRGEIYSMGQNYGSRNREIHFSPQLIPSPHKFTLVRCGWSHSVALTDDGKVWEWGGKYLGGVLLPIPTEYIPMNGVPFLPQIPELDSHRVVSVECGGHYSLALTDRGEVYHWGAIRSGQLSYGSVTSTNIPTRFPTPSPVQSIAAGYSHTLLLTRTGEVWACGWNGFGQLGIPTRTDISYHLVKVEGLPPISKIASNSFSFMSIAMSFDKRCFVWGQLRHGKLEEKLYISISTPLKLSPFYSTVESPLSFYSSHRNTPHSVTIPETPPSPLSARMSRMFDNPETSPDVQFVVEQRTIHAHRIILSNSSDYFARMFSDRSMGPVDPENSIGMTRVTIPDHSHQVFHSFLRFLYTDSFEVYPDLLPELFEVASQYLVPDLHQACLSRMRTTLTPTTCCLYYSLTHRHSLLPELATFQQELVQFASTRMSEVVNSASYKSMVPDLHKNFHLNFI